MPANAELVAQAHACRQAGDLPSAEQLYRRALDSDPANAELHYLLGETCRGMGKLELATAALNRAIAANPRLAAAHNALGAVFGQQGRFAEAGACCQRAIDIEPGEPHAYYNLAAVAASQNQLERAAELWRRTIELAPDHVDAVRNLATAALKLNQPDVAADCRRRVAELRPEEADAHYQLGVVLAQQGALPEAAAAYRRAIELKPDAAGAHYNLGAVSEQQQALDTAADCYRRAAELRPDLAIAHRSLRNVLEKQGRFAEAEAACRRALDGNPNRYETEDLMAQLSRIAWLGAAPHANTERPSAPAAHDFSLGFRSQRREIQVDRLETRGTVPAWLSGTLVRNGPAQFEVGSQSYRHWFDGLAMLHRFAFDNGQVAYSNRFLRSPAYESAQQSGRIRYSEFATDPCRSIFSRLMTLFSNPTGSNANVNIARLAGRAVAMTETPMAIEFSPEMLDTLGVFDYPDDLRGQLTTAHPHLDAARGEAINYVTRMGFQSQYQIYRIPQGSSARQLIASLKVKEPAYMHSFALTERYVVLVEFPLVVQPWRLMLGGRPFIENYRWQPERGTRFLVVDRADGRLRGTYEAPAFFVFHHVNAFERDDELVLDMAAYPDPKVIDAFYLDKLRDPGHVVFAAELRRYRLPLSGSTAEYEVLCSEPIELPRIDYRHSSGRDYQFVYGVGSRSGPTREFFNQLVRIDVRSGTAVTWFAEGCFPGEPVLVPAPGARGENEGVVLSVVLDANSGGSFLLVLDAGLFTEVARAVVPQHIPFGIHGQFFASE